MRIEPNSSCALPIDKISSSISFYLEKVSENHESQVFQADSLFKQPPKDIILGSNFALIRKCKYPTLTTLFFEPMATLRNCLPFSVSITLIDKSEYAFHVLETQEVLKITSFSKETQIKFQLTSQTFSSNIVPLIPLENESSPSLILSQSDKRISLNTHASYTVSGFTSTIFAQMCIVNESGENIHFVAFGNVRIWASPFCLTTIDGAEIVLFDHIPEVRMCTKSEYSPISDPVPLEQEGTHHIDVLDRDKGYLNLGVEVTSVLCGINFYF